MNADSMSSGWYYSKRGAPAGTQAGPLTWEQLYSQAQAGQLGPDDLVWNAQLPDWLPAAQIPGLFPAAATPAAATPVARPPASYQPVAAAPTGRKRSRLLPILIPLIALIVVGGGLGAYFGFLRGGNDNGVASSSTASSTVSGQTTSTTAGGTNVGTVEIKAPERAKLVATTTFGEVPANQIIVMMADGKSRKDAESLAKALGGTVVGELEFVNAYQIETSGTTEADLTAALSKAAATDGVESAFPNQELSLGAEIWGVRQTPLTDPLYGGGNGKGYELIGVQKAWDYMRGSGLHLWNVQVGVVDTGLYKGTHEFDGAVNTTFPDQAAGSIPAPDKLLDADGNPTTTDDPTGGHGTAVAGIIGADADNGNMTGVASNLGHKLTVAQINMYTPPYGNAESSPDPNDPTKYVWPDGKTYVLGNLAAMLKQVEAGSKVVNCSFQPAGGPNPNHKEMAAAFRKFFQKMSTEHPDVTFVCAAGNYNTPLTTENSYPAGAGSGLSNVITVGNIMNDSTKAGSSNTAGSDGEITLAAPGQQAVQGTNTDGSAVNQHGGTSMAAPQVSAAAAMLLSLDPNLSAADIKQILSDTARPGPDSLGGKILAIDQAVLEVINQQREKQGLPAVTADDLEKAGAVDAVATTTDHPERLQRPRNPDRGARRRHRRRHQRLGRGHRRGRRGDPEHHRGR